MPSTLHALIEVVTDATVPALLVDLNTVTRIATSTAFDEYHLDSTPRNPAFELMRSGVINGYEYDRFIPATETLMRFWARGVGRPPAYMLGVFTQPGENDHIVEHLTVLPVSPALRVVLHGAPLVVGDVFDRLTPRETQILVKLSQGETAPAIADALYLSRSTVRNHLASIFRKFGVRSQIDLLRVVGHQKLEMPDSSSTDVEADVGFQNADADGSLSSG